MNITDHDLELFRKRADKELAPCGLIGRLDWNLVVRSLCNEVESLRLEKNAKSAKKEKENMKPYQTVTIREDEKGKLRIEILANGGYTNRQRRLMNQIAKCFPKSAIVVPMTVGGTK